MNCKRRDRIVELIDQLEAVKAEVEAVLADEQEYYNGIPENMLGSSRAESSYEAIDNLEFAVTAIDECREYLDLARA